MTGSRPTNHTSPSPFNQLRRQMAESFSLDDVRSLCFDLNVNFDELPHAGLTPKVRDLILLMKQNGRLAELLTAVAKARPHVEWPDLVPPAPQQ